MSVEIRRLAGRDRRHSARHEVYGDAGCLSKGHGGGSQVTPSAEARPDLPPTGSGVPDGRPRRTARPKSTAARVPCSHGHARSRHPAPGPCMRTASSSIRSSSCRPPAGSIPLAPRPAHPPPPAAGATRRSRHSPPSAGSRGAPAPSPPAPTGALARAPPRYQATAGPLHLRGGG